MISIFRLLRYSWFWPGFHHVARVLLLGIMVVFPFHETVSANGNIGKNGQHIPNQENGFSGVLVGENLGNITSFEDVACTLYVSTEGSDTNEGIQEDFPFRTLQKAADVARAGDVVCVMAGVYEERFVIRNSGTEDSPIVFQAERGANGDWITIIEGGDPVDNWIPAPEICDGVYKTTSIAYNPRSMTLDNRQIARIHDEYMSGDTYNGESGLDWLCKSASSTVTTRYLQETIGFWDGIEVLYGYLDGVTYIHFRNGDDPNGRELKASPAGAGVLMDEASHVVLRGFLIRGAQNAVQIQGAGSRNNVVEENFLTNGHNRVLIRTGAASNHIRHNEMTMNYYGHDDFGAWGDGSGKAYAIREYLYSLVFKHMVGHSSSDDHGVYLYYAGDQNEVYGNHMFQGLIGFIAWSPATETVSGLKVYDNIIHNMSSVGVVAINGFLENAQFFKNLIYDCNINLRIHEYGTESDRVRTAYIYQNRSYLPEGVGDHIYVHWNTTDLSEGFIHPEWTLYHNSFAGGSAAISLSYYGENHGMPNTSFINNVISSKRFLEARYPAWHEEGRIGIFDYNWVVGTVPYSEFPNWFGSHNIDGGGQQLWDPSQMPDFTLPQDHPAREVGIDLSRSFVLEGKQFGPLPGMEPEYFSGSRPDLGAIQGSSPSTSFIDVPIDHWAHDYIEVLYQEGFIAGCSQDPLMYCPEDTLTRAESAVFVERGLHGAEFTPSDPTQQIFADVPLTEWFAKWSQALWDDGYTAGCGTDPLTYCPLQDHTRAEGSVFFLRMMHGADYDPPEPVGFFVDVPTTAWYADWAEAAYNAGIIPACETEPELRFCPEDPLDRAMAAYMMVQAKGISLMDSSRISP
jgi:hypothetical protein